MDYVDKDEARSGGLISSTDTAVYIGVDYLHPVSTRGRKSVRISTKERLRSDAGSTGSAAYAGRGMRLMACVVSQYQTPITKMTIH